MKVIRGAVVEGLHLLVRRDRKLVWTPDDGKRKTAEALSCCVEGYPYAVVPTLDDFHGRLSKMRVGHYTCARFGCSNGRTADSFRRLVERAQRRRAVCLLGASERVR